MVRLASAARGTERNLPMKAYSDREEGSVEPLLISANKTAQLLGLSARYLYTLTKERQIRVVAVGRKRLYRLADIQRFIEDRSDGAAPVGP
jgi:excisionase family DNA binding protein